MPRAPLLLAVAVLGVVGCGGSDAPPPVLGSSPAVPDTPDVAVVREWSEALRRGDVDTAVQKFALGATVSNGTPEIRLSSRADVRAFNSSLACGAKLIKAIEHHGAIIATFRLTDRPGGNCGSGVGATARTAFKVKDGRIVRWLRLPNAGSPDGAPPRRPLGDPA